ncbi:MAG: DUF58 domain-containing protein [Dehalococcoidia bacterium]|nr:DUF58 domain-containing protein [Chloroflexi bacterium CFX7]MCL4231378.1 DUF58 domain-containing protein [Dehalococcoidia bacterium]NUQ55629.1 DUF58 domain-containing protein [Dehalococcoidia bacterium]RIL03799.1 MAG: DUF58 domain-containing protein [bacterium]
MRRLARAAFDPEHRTLTLVVVILLCALFLAFGTGFELLFRLAWVVGLIIPASWLIAWSSTRGINVEVQRRTGRAQVGQEAQEVIEVFNRSLLPRLWLEVDDPSDMPGHNSRRVVIVPARGSRSWLVDTPLVQRGLYDWGPVQVVGTDPFGLFRRKKLFGHQEQILVYPPVFDLPHFHAPPANLPGEGRFRRRTHYVTPNASGIREYAPGDAFNRIHWPSTVRTGHLMVKTFELDPASDIWVILDMERRVNFGSGNASTEEYGVRVAASVARHFLVQNRSVGLITFGRDLQVVEAERGTQQLTRVLETLATARAVGDAPVGNILMEEQRRFGRHTTVVLVTSSTDDLWLSGLLSLTQRGVKAAVVLVDASSFGGREAPLMIYGALTAADILTYVVRNGDDLGLALSPAQAPEGASRWQS